MQINKACNLIVVELVTSIDDKSFYKTKNDFELRQHQKNNLKFL